MAPADTIQVLAFRVGSRRFVVDVRRVAGLLGRPTVEAAAASREGLLGYVDWRGSGLALFDVARLLDGDAAAEADAEAEPRAVAPHPRVLILMTDVGPVGLLIDEAEQVLSLSPSACVAEPLSGAVPTPWSLGLCRLRGQLYAMLDPRALTDCLVGHPVGTLALQQAGESSLLLPASASSP